ncbi:MAG: DUF4827 domain-containing protein [Paramuribaculum sp.]|nr:DUF4827 domain-containing protein [Paramuribaculum sp.]
MKIRIVNTLIAAVALIACSAMQSCSDRKSYAQMLEDENKAVNLFLADQKVIGYIADNKDFITGKDAPFYQLDPEGNLYMQVIEKGDGPMVSDNQVVYFRFTRYNINYYTSEGGMTSEGNSETIEYGDQSFRYGNTSLESSTQWGTGIQVPLSVLPLNSHVKLVVKSQLGWYSEISYVTPFLYDIRYFPGKI